MLKITVKPNEIHITDIDSKEFFTAVVDEIINTAKLVGVDYKILEE